MEELVRNPFTSQPNTNLLSVSSPSLKKIDSFVSKYRNALVDPRPFVYRLGLCMLVTRFALLEVF